MEQIPCIPAASHPGNFLNAELYLKMWSYFLFVDLFLDSISHFQELFHTEYSIGSVDCSWNNRSETKVNISYCRLSVLILDLPYHHTPAQQFLGYVWPCSLSPDMILMLACWQLSSLTLDVPCLGIWTLSWTCLSSPDPFCWSDSQYFQFWRVRG